MRSSLQYVRLTLFISDTEVTSNFVTGSIRTVASDVCFLSPTIVSFKLNIAATFPFLALILLSLSRSISRLPFLTFSSSLAMPSFNSLTFS